MLDPFAGKLNPPGGKKGVLVNTATSQMGVHEDRKDFEKELKQQKSFQSKTGWCLSAKKKKKWVKHIWQKQQVNYEQVEKWDSV